MQANVGTVDRVLRVAVGLTLVAGAVSGGIGAWGWIGLLPIATGLFRVCPTYMSFGLSTCRIKKPD